MRSFFLAFWLLVLPSVSLNAFAISCKDFDSKNLKEKNYLYNSAMKNFIQTLHLYKTFDTLQSLLNASAEGSQPRSLPLREIPMLISANFLLGWSGLYLVLTELTQQLDRIADCFYTGRLTREEEMKFLIISSTQSQEPPYVGFMLNDNTRKELMVRVTKPESCNTDGCKFFDIELDKKTDRSIILLIYDMSGSF